MNDEIEESKDRLGSGRLVIDNIADLSPNLARSIDEWVMNGVWLEPGLTERERRISTLSMVAALGVPAALDIHIPSALEAGFSEEEIVAIFHHVAVYAGIPRSLEATTHLKRILEQRASSSRGRGMRQWT